jgi:hypothetical protein
MDVATIRVRVVPNSDPPVLRMLFHTYGVDGVYVDVPISGVCAALITNPRQGVHELAAAIENGLSTLVLIGENPDAAVRAGIITADDAERIKKLLTRSVQ